MRQNSNSKQLFKRKKIQKDWAASKKNTVYCCHHQKFMKGLVAASENAVALKQKKRAFTNNFLSDFKKN